MEQFVAVAITLGVAGFILAFILWNVHLLVGGQQKLVQVAGLRAEVGLLRERLAAEREQLENLRKHLLDNVMVPTTALAPEQAEGEQTMNMQDAHLALSFFCLNVDEFFQFPTPEPGQEPQAIIPSEILKNMVRLMQRGLNQEPTWNPPNLERSDP